MTTDAETEKPNPDTQEDLTPKGPEDEGSLAAALEKAPKVIFSGHPAEEGGGVLPIGPGEGDEPGETRTAPDGEGAGDGEQPKEPEFKPKHKTWEETERARREAESTMTKAKQEAAEERKARETAEQELNELRQKATEKPPDTPATEKPPSKEEAKARVKQALKAIRELDEDDPDYDEKVAEAWAEAGIGSLNKDEISKIISQQVQDNLKAEREAEKAAKAEATKKEREAKIVTDAEELAVKSGLNMDKGSLESRLFWDLAKDVPEDIGAKPLKEQVEWVVKEVRNLTGQAVQTKEEQREAARRHQINNTPLERGATRVKTPPKQQTTTMGGFIEKAMEQRRI